MSLANWQYRLHWANTMTFCTLDSWKDVVFSDECRFGLKNDSENLRVCGSPQEASNPEFFQPTFSNFVSVMVWGCIGPNRVARLIMCERSVNSEYYCQILQDNLFQSVTRIYRNRNKPFIFLQDNATLHTSEYTRIFFGFHQVLVLPWPLQNPDLNLIENVWLWMKNRNPPTTKQELTQRIFQVWN